MIAVLDTNAIIGLAKGTEAVSKRVAGFASGTGRILPPLLPLGGPPHFYLDTCVN
jgi:hypothetical protein